VVLLVAVLVVRSKLLARGIPQYDAAAVARKRKAGEALVLLDVRTDAERSVRSIKGSRHIPLQELQRRLPELENDRAGEIVCYCASGARSASAAHLLKKAGFRSANLSGGIAAWRDDA
jgi:rhodanese-related sulfurtransferase